MHETLVTREELMKADEYEDYYRIRNLSQIDYNKYFTDGTETSMPEQDYTSQNTRRLDLVETKELFNPWKRSGPFLHENYWHNG